jgi:glucose-1-phosphate thymidylyltransferase
LTDEYVGVILAAGRGRRMGALGEEYPKALLPVANEPLIGHHLRLLSGLGVRTVYLIVGHRGPDLMSALGAGERYGVTLRYVTQDAPLGSAHALGCLRPWISQPFLLILGDYYFSASDPGRLLRRLREGTAAIAAKREPNRRLLTEACAIQVDQDGRVVHIAEKPIAPASSLKGCGFYALQPEMFDAVARTPRTALRDEYELMVSLEFYVKAGHRLHAEEIVVWDAHFTSPQDVLECNMQWLAKAGRSELVGNEARIADGVRLERAVVGNHAQVNSRSVLRDVVVFSGATLASGPVVERALVTPEALHLLGPRECMPPCEDGEYASDKERGRER